MVCLHAGIMPNVYQDAITEIEVKEVRRKNIDADERENSMKEVVY